VSLASPLLRLAGSFVSGTYNGDDTSHPHEALWDLENYIRGKGGRPTEVETARAVVVGGGMAGLLSAYFLRDLSPVLLEQAPQFGGNAKGEEYRGTSFSIGAAYTTIPEPGGDVATLFQELGLASAGRREAQDDSKVCFHGLKRLWKGETDPAAAAAFREVSEKLTAVYEDAYPDIPWTPESKLSREQFDALDRETAQGWLRRTFPNLHPHVEEFFQVYCWSSFGGSLEELSAAQFLNFVASETQGEQALPGGNSAITRGLWQALGGATEPRLRAGALALEVKNVADGVEVLYEDAAGKLRRLRAKCAVVAAPKLVARYIVKGLDPARDALWKELTYRAYVVANVLLKRRAPDSSYDVFRLEGAVPAAPSFGSRTDRAFTDFIFADWANAGRGEASVLTFYRPYPFEGARSILMNDASFGRVRGEIEAGLPKLLAELGIEDGEVAGVRLTRWGHAMPLARPGLASEEASRKLGAPHGKIAFANQDNCVNPAFETCFAAAKAAADFARRA
jgi:glycine/D-amino acid oxidase-like deaminating enzyme